MPFSFSIGPPNSIWISSFGSIHFGKGVHLQCGISDFKFFPIYAQALHSLALASISDGHMATKHFVLATA